MAWDDTPPTKEEISKILSVDPDQLNGMLNGRYPDTGRAAGSPGERMDSLFGGPSRAAISSMQNGDFSVAPAAAWNKFNTDPQVNPAPSGEDLVRKAGVTNPYAAKGLGFLANVASDPVTLASFGAGKLPGMAGEIYDASKMFGKKNPPGARKALTEAMALEKDAPALVNTTTPTGNLVDVNAPQEMANPGKEPIGGKFFPPFPEAVEPVRGKGAFWNDPNDQRFTDDAKDVMNNLDARFPKGKETKAFRKQLSDAQDGPDHQPYVGKEVSGFDSHTLPNFAAKPIGVIGNDTINVPSTSNTSNPDPFPWMDSKYGSGKQLLAKHQSLDMPADIHTSSDLIGRDDYISKIPEGSTVNMHVLTPDDTLNRVIFPGNPSNERLMDAVARLKGAGVNTNVVRPTVEDVLGAVKNGEQGFSDQTGVENPKEYLQKMGLQTDAERSQYPPLTPVKAQMGAVSPSIPRSPQSTSASWDSTPPTQAEMDQINGVKPAQTQSQAEPQSASTASDDQSKIYKNINDMNEQGDASNDALFDTLTMGHLAQIKAKLGQLLSGEGVSNNADYVKRRDAVIADMKALAERQPAGHIEGKAVGFVAPMLLSGGGSGAAEAAGTIGADAAEAAGGTLAKTGGPEAMGADQITGASEAAANAGRRATDVTGTIPKEKFLTAVGKGALTGAAMGAAQNPGDTPGVVDPIQADDRFQNAKTGAIMGGTVGAIANKIPDIADAVDAYANRKNFKGTGAMVKDYRKNYANDTIEPTGKFIRDNKLLSAGDTYQDVADKAEALRQQTGKDLGSGYDTTAKILPRLDPDSAAKVNAAGFNPVRDKAAIIAGAQDELGYAYHGDKALQSLSDYIDKLANQHGDVTLSPQETNKIKTALDKTAINWERNPLTREPDTETALKSLRGYLNGKVKGQIQTLGEAVGQPDAAAALTAMNEKYGMASRVATIAGDRAQREAANKAIGLTDTIAGGAGATTGAIIGHFTGLGPEAGALIGAPVAAAGNKLARTYGNQLVAVGADKAANALKAMPKIPLATQANPGLYNTLANDSDSKSSDKGDQVRTNQVPNAAPLTGPSKWASDGHAALMTHATDPADLEMLNSQRATMLKDPKTRDMLMQASDLKPGSKAMNAILTKLKSDNSGDDK